jgi:predicted N-acyltransferase
MRVFAAAGYDVAVEPAAQCWRDLAPLFAQTQRRYGHDADDAYAARVLQRQAAALPDVAQIITARRAGALVGGVLCYVWRGALYLKLHGLDYPRLRDAYEYFNLGFYAAMRLAGEQGLTRLHYGHEGLDAKARRGAALWPLWSVPVQAMPIAPGTERDRQWNARAAAAIAAQCPVPRAFADPGWRRWGCADA